MVLDRIAERINKQWRREGYGLSVTDLIAFQPLPRRCSIKEDQDTSKESITQESRLSKMRGRQA